MQSLTTVQDGNGVLCASGCRFTGLMGYYLSRTMTASNMLLRAESNVDKKGLNTLVGGCGSVSRAIH